MAENKESGLVQKVSFATLSILQLIKDAQQKHGLRHGDYQRYRAYCGRKVRRIRKSLKFTHTYKCVSKHPGKFVVRPIALEAVSEQRYLQIAVFDAERCWSYAMQLKQEAGDDANSRKKFHALSKLRSAVKHSANLEAICRQLEMVDAVSKLESQAYNAWMNGCLHVDLKKWKQALEQFRTARKIYEKLAGVVTVSELGELYRQRCNEMQPQIRFCEFNASENQTTEAMSELMNMRMQLGDEGGLSDEFDKLIAEMHARTAATAKGQKTITWAGKQLTMTNPKMVQLLQVIEQVDGQIAGGGTYEEKLALYEKQLADIRDVIQALRDESAKTGAAGKPTDHGPPGSDGNAGIMMAYLDYVRLDRATRRYLLMIEQIRSPVSAADNNATEKKTKQWKPQDVLRLYDTIIENFEETAQLPGAQADSGFQAALQTNIAFYKAFRCFYMAEAYSQQAKWTEATVLYERCLKRIADGKKLVSNLQATNAQLDPTKVNAEELIKLGASVQAGQLAVQASRLAEASAGGGEGGTPMDTTESGQLGGKALIDALDEYQALNIDQLTAPPAGLQQTGSSQQQQQPAVRLVNMPPLFQPMPNKPIFFDLAQNHIKMPSLESKLADTAASPAGSKQKPMAATASDQQDQQGITGMMKGWFWGKK